MGRPPSSVSILERPCIKLSWIKLGIFTRTGNRVFKSEDLRDHIFIKRYISLEVRVLQMTG